MGTTGEGRGRGRSFPISENPAACRQQCPCAAVVAMTIVLSTQLVVWCPKMLYQGPVPRSLARSFLSASQNSAESMMSCIAQSCMKRSHANKVISMSFRQKDDALLSHFAFRSLTIAVMRTLLFVSPVKIISGSRLALKVQTPLFRSLRIKNAKSANVGHASRIMLAVVFFSAHACACRTTSQACYRSA